jgi:hypothetical protein
MKTTLLTYATTLLMSLTLAACTTNGSQTNVASDESVQPVSAREAADRAFEYRRQAAILRDQATRLELEAQVAMEEPATKEEAARSLERAKAMRAAANNAEAAAQEYRRQVPHNQMY